MLTAIVIRFKRTKDATPETGLLLEGPADNNIFDLEGDRLEEVWDYTVLMHRGTLVVRDDEPWWVDDLGSHESFGPFMSCYAAKQWVNERKATFAHTISQTPGFKNSLRYVE